MCLGQDDAAEFRDAAARPGVDDAALAQAIRDAIARKPKGHDFVIDRRRKSPRRGAPHEHDRRLTRCRAWSTG